ncbi:MAG TPA: complex I NDUFA9 subunit family protein [Caulobacteraceae bacterium]|jgi:NADH dehydrogenase|nr:complex I NDUFA9 subunit family protein [Caulobacteraceae bacterium]
MQGLVTVFGGSGFLGSYVVRALAKRGWRIRVACRRPNLAYRLRPMGDVGQIQLFQANVGVPETVEQALEGAEACVNLVGVLYQTPKRSFQRVHVEGARNVAGAATARGITKFVQVSAIGADPDAPSVYARTKGEGEAQVRKQIASARVLRPSVLFGPEDDFFNRFAAMSGWSPALPLIGGGKTRFQPAYVADVGRAVAQCLDDDATAGKTFELGGPRVYTFKELMQILLRETHRSRLLVPVPGSIAGLIGIAGDIEAAITPFKPMLTSDQALLLESDNVVGDKAEGFAALGITPADVESIVPTYLWRYRKDGQFADAVPT